MVAFEIVGSFTERLSDASNKSGAMIPADSSPDLRSVKISAFPLISLSVKLLLDRIVPSLFL